MSALSDWPAGYDRVVLPETDSTMSEARRRVATIAGPTWICALQQAAAQGRRGRAWAMPPGNFAATLVLRPEGDAGQAALRSFTASLALYNALKRHIAPDRLSLKWPNDVLLDGGKLAGILLESSGQGDRVDWLAIGIGVNLAAAPDPTEVEKDAVHPVSLAGAGGATVTPEDFLTDLAAAFARHEASFQAQGFAPLHRLWMRHAARLGETITARLPNETLTGTFETVDEAGQLILRTPAGPRVIAAADVFFP